MGAEGDSPDVLTFSCSPLMVMVRVDRDGDGDDMLRAWSVKNRRTLKACDPWRLLRPNALDAKLCVVCCFCWLRDEKISLGNETSGR
jgi:hypothetical protein